MWYVQSAIISLIAKRKKDLPRSVIFSKVPSSKPTSLLKLTLHSSSSLLDFQYTKIFWGKFGIPGSFFTSALVSYKLVSYKIKIVYVM